MLMLIVVMAALAIGLLRGGSLHGLAQISLRWTPLVVIGLLLQLLIFTPGREQSIVTVFVPQIYILSMLILAVWVVANRRVPGIVVMGVGLLMNLAAIAANGGYMPVDPELARLAGQMRESQVVNNSRAMSEQVQLWILTDILPIPAFVPFANVYSIGDVLLALGGSLLLYRSVRDASASGRSVVQRQNT